MDPRTGIVIATRDRHERLLSTLDRLAGLPERPPVVVVDNASRDGTPAAVRSAFPSTRVIEAGANLGAGARTLGARVLRTPYVAFNDDDSWFAPGALSRAADVLDAHARLGLVAARVLVGERERLDPVCQTMSRSPLSAGRGVPGHGVLGFVACGAVVRRTVFLDVGGFDARYGVGGEEGRLALDLAAVGWRLAYVADVVVHHHPGVLGPRPGRRACELRNELWSTWLRRPLPSVLRRTARVVARGWVTGPRIGVDGVLGALGGLPWIARERRVVPPHVERALRAVEALDHRW